jgi:hypothetical protein
VASLVVVDGLVAQVFVVRNPEKLHTAAHDRRRPDLGSGA